MGTVSVWWLPVGMAGAFLFGLFWGWIRGLQMAGAAFARRAQECGLQAELYRLLDRMDDR